MSGILTVDVLQCDTSSASSINIVSPVIASSKASFLAGSAAAPSISTVGDPNTGIFFPAADSVAFTANGTEALKIVNSDSLFAGAVYGYQPEHTTTAVNITLTVAQLLTRIIYVTSGAVKLKMPTATALNSGLIAGLPTNGSIEFTIIHNGAGSNPTLEINNGVTIVGFDEAKTTAATFRLCKTGASTYVVYRLNRR